MNIEQRPEQTKIVDEIIEALDSGVTNVVLSAPTGWGKSILAWRVAKELGLSAAVLSHQKVLLDQYHSTFWEDDFKEFATLKGKQNYPCPVKKGLTAALAPCAFSDKYKCPKKKTFECPYYKAREEGIASGFLNTNYQYIWTMYDNVDEFNFAKDLYIYDEAHTVHGLYTDHRSPSITDLDLKLYKRQADFAFEHNIDELEHWATKLVYELSNLDFEKSQDDEYLLETFNRIFTLKKQNALAISSYLHENTQELCENGKITLVGALDKIECKSKNAMEKVLSERPDLDECVLELNKGDRDSFSFTMTPFDIGKLFATEAEMFSPARIFMSATLIDPEGFLNRLGYSAKHAKIIELDSKFPIEHRPIYVAPKSNIKLNYDTIKNHKENLVPFLEITKDLVLQYASQGHSGVIFTSSYELTEIVSNYMRIHTNDEVDLFFNMDTSEREKVLEDFKTDNGKPRVLISCSFYEGINLSDDLSRYNIIFKLPYKSLGSKYVKTVHENDPILYATWCLNDVVQAAGRSVRNQEDWADTYIIDPAFRGMLFYNKRLFPKWFKKAISYL